MDADQITKVLGYLGCDQIQVIAGKNVMGTCPLNWNHQEGDRFGSFSVEIVPQGSSRYNCFGCKAGGNFRDAVFLWFIRAGFPEGWEKLIAWVDRVETEDPVDLVDGAMAEGVAKASGAAPVAGRQGRGGRALPVYPESSLDKFEDKVHPYITAPVAEGGRGVPTWLAEAYGVCWDPAARRVVFPVRLPDGGLVGAQGRPVVTDEELDTGAHGPKYYNYLQFPRAGVMYGEHVLANAAHASALKGSSGAEVCAGLVEGVFDVFGVTLALWDQGVYGVATFGAELSEFQADALCSLVSRVYLFGDGDKGGDGWLAKARERLYGRVQLWECEIPVGNDPGAMSSGEIRSVFGGALPAAPTEKQTKYPKPSARRARRRH